MTSACSMAMWTCYLCSFKTVDIARLKYHISNLHSTQQQPDKKRPQIQDLSNFRHSSSTPDVIVLKSNSYPVATVNKGTDFKSRSDAKEGIDDVHVIEIKKRPTPTEGTPIIKYFGNASLPLRCKFCLFLTNSFVGMKRHENRQHKHQFLNKVKDSTGSEEEPEIVHVYESDTKRSKQELKVPAIQASKVPLQTHLVKGPEKLLQLDNHKVSNVISGTETLNQNFCEKRDLVNLQDDAENKTLEASKISVDSEMSQNIGVSSKKPPLKQTQELNESFVRIDGVRCKSCPHIASSPVLLQVHVDRDHGGGIFLQSESLGRNLRERNINIINVNDKTRNQPKEKNSKHFCLQCKEYFANERCFKIHNKSKHEVVNRSNNRRRYPVVKTVRHLKYFGHHNGNCIKYKCSICRKMLVSKSSLQKHTKSVHEMMRRKISKQILTSTQDQAMQEFNWAHQMGKRNFLMLFSLKNA